MKTVHVSAAVIIENHRILCVQKGKSNLDYISNKWEFPGGKIEEEEQSEQTVIREILEELNLKIKVKEFLVQVDYQYPDFRIIMDVFICDVIGGQLQLKEHIDFRWLKKKELTNLDWAAADVPIIKALQS